MIREDSKAQKMYMRWLRAKDVGPISRRELHGMVSDLDEIEARFSCDPVFGEAGMTAPIGIGTDRMNVWTAARTAFGIAKTVCDADMRRKGLVVAYDARENSREFAEAAARICAREGVQVFFLRDPAPLSLVSFAVREFSCAGGIVVTSADERPGYGGIRAYAPGGSHISETAARAVKNRIDISPDPFDMLETAEDFDMLCAKARIVNIPSKLFGKYIDRVRPAADFTEIGADARSSLKISYSCARGTAEGYMGKMFDAFGFTDVTAIYEMGREEAVKAADDLGADILFLTDHNGTSLEVAAREKDGSFGILTGNMAGSLVIDFLLLKNALSDRPKEDIFCIASMVSAKTAKRICDVYGAKLYATMRESRYFTALIRENDEEGKGNFIAGFDEKGGCMIGKAAMEKDAMLTAIVLSLVAASVKASGVTLFDQLRFIAKECGDAAERNVSFTREDEIGKETLEAAIRYLRKEGSHFGAKISDATGVDVEKFVDLAPRAEMLCYKLSDDGRLIAYTDEGGSKLVLHCGFYGDDAERKAAALSVFLETYFGMFLDEYEKERKGSEVR